MGVLQELRAKKRLTQQELSDILSVPRTTLAHYEGGGNEMSYGLLIKTADFFDVSVDALVGRKPSAELFSDARVPKSEVQQLFDELDRAGQQEVIGYIKGMLYAGSAAKNKHG